MSFAQKIEDWYAENGRVLPWRGIDDPYRIWLSEIILQQTRIEQGRSYYDHFIHTYPTVADLAHATEEKVLKSWQGLGYYSRARNLRIAAQQIMNQYGGVFPDTYHGIKSLKGVGRYTAAAIASFAFKLPYPVIDGNVYRLISRVFGVYTPIGTDTAYKEYEALLYRLIDHSRPDIFNQAMMDFGSTYCKPSAPDCENCIFRQECVAHREDKVDVLPIKGKPVRVHNRYFYYLHLIFPMGTAHATLVGQRTDNDIWKGLYEFPLLEQEYPLDPSAVAEVAKAKTAEIVKGNPTKIEVAQPLVHKLTHRTIVATFVRLYFDQQAELINKKYSAVKEEELKKYPVSRLIDKYLTKSEYLFSSLSEKKLYLRNQKSKD